MSAISILGFLLLIGSPSTADPLYPPNAVYGGTVLALLHFGAGGVPKVSIISGNEPFLSSSKDALAQWRMQPKQDSSELVVVHFRSPYLQDFRSSGTLMPEFEPSRNSVPYPRFLQEPSYPANALGQGSVILRVEIGASGQVLETQIIKSIGGLTDAVVEAVKRWEFAPGLDEKGRKVRSHAYVVLVFRLPLVSK